MYEQWAEWPETADMHRVSLRSLFCSHSILPLPNHEYTILHAFNCRRGTANPQPPIANWGHILYIDSQQDRRCNGTARARPYAAIYRAHPRRLRSPPGGLCEGQGQVQMCVHHNLSMTPWQHSIFIYFLKKKHYHRGFQRTESSRSWSSSRISRGTITRSGCPLLFRDSQYAILLFSPACLRLLNTISNSYIQCGLLIGQRIRTRPGVSRAVSCAV